MKHEKMFHVIILIIEVLHGSRLLCYKGELTLSTLFYECHVLCMFYLCAFEN